MSTAPAIPTAPSPVPRRTCGWPALVTGGWLLTRSAIAAAAMLDGDAGGFSAEFLEQKLVTARFYATQLLPQAAGLLPAITAGAADLFAATF